MERFLKPLFTNYYCDQDFENILLNLINLFINNRLFVINNTRNNVKS